MAATDLPGDAKHVRRADSEDRTQIMVLDISRAYFNAKKDEGVDPTYVELPAEDPDRAEGMCGLLRVHRYEQGQRRTGGTTSIRVPWKRWGSCEETHRLVCSGMPTADLWPVSTEMISQYVGQRNSLTV